MVVVGVVTRPPASGLIKERGEVPGTDIKPHQQKHFCIVKEEVRVFLEFFLTKFIMGDGDCV